MTTDYQAQFNELKTSLIASLKGYFPIIGRKHQLEVGDIWVDDNLSIRDFPAQIEAYEKKGDFSVPVYASLVLRNIDGSVIEKRNKLKIMSMPKVTSRGTYMLGGNEYQVPYQLRLKPNVYNRIKDNGELETFINIKPVALHLYLDPEKATFSLRFGSQKKVSLYPFLSGLGVSDAEMAASWGQDIVDMNRNSRGNPQSEVYKFFEMAFNRSPANMQEAVEGCLMYLAEKELDKEGTKLTIGRSHERLSTQVLLDSAKKLVSLNRKEEEPDERDAIHFKKIVHVEDFLKDRLENEKRSLIFKIKQRLDSKESIREILKPDVFDTPIHTFFTTSSSSNHANTLNPLSMLAEARKVTIMGEGGIEDENAITEDARAVHPSQLGFIDPIHTPEGGNIGSVNQLALVADKKGNELITRLINLKTNKYDEVTPSQASQSIIAFSDQFENKNGVFKPKYKTVKASIRNQIGMVDPKEVDYIMTNDKQIFSFASNMTPFINHISGNRSMMSGKHMEQAVPLKFREAPLVQNKLTSNKTFEKHLSDEVETAAEINGTVTKISKDKITVEGPNGPIEHFIYNKFINPTDKVYMHHEPLVSVGDKVKKGQPLTKSNYSDNGSYAIGTNMTVAFTPYKGYTFEDGVAVSESAAKKLTSLHMYKEKVEIDANSILDKKKFLAYFPTKITSDNFSKLGDDGVIKEGSIVRQNDYLVAHLHKEDYTKEDMLIASFNKKFLKPYKDRSIVWEEDFEGKVVRVIRRPKEIEVQIETEEAARVGDKLSGRAGNKGIITHIIPDNEVPQTESGQPIDVFLNPHGIVGRINPAQILESYAGRIAEKVGAPYVVDNFSGENYFEKINSEITKLKIPEKEFLTDKAGNKIIENPIAVGKMHVLKLNHPVRKKFQAREDRSYTIDMQPTSGGGEGGRKMDQLSIYSMLSHGATKNLQESMTYKGEKNDEFWHAYQAGLPLPKPKVPFVFDKFQSMLKASGINMERFGDQFQVMPLTSDGIKSISNGEIQEPEFVQGKNLNTIKGGLFDPDITGGREGTKWSHVTLSEAMPNPVFEGAILSVLEMKKDDYDQIIGGKKYVDKFGFINNEGRGVTGGEAIKTLLSKINVDQQILSATESAKTAKDSELNRVHRKLRYLKALKKLDMSPSVYVTNTVPVIPPIFRPITPDKGNRLNISPANTLYRDMMLINGQLKKAKENGLPDSEVSELRKNLYKAYGSLVGTEKGITDTSQKEQQGFIQLIAGKKPKEGFFQDKMLAKRQDFSGTSTVVPEPGYGLDDIGIPYDMLWSTYKPHVIRRLQQLGYTPNAAIKEVEERTALAKSILDQETQERPVIINRAPSLHKFSLLSFKPRPVEGKAIKVNPLIVGGFNMDFDGDTVGVHVPISEDAKIEAHKMLASNNIFDPQTSGIVHKPQSEHVTGLYMMTTPGEKSGKKYKDFESAIADYKAGNLKINNVISVAGKNLTLGIALVNSVLPNEYRDYEKPVDGKRLKSVLFEIAKNKPGEYGHVVSQLKNLGNEAIDKLGLTSGLSDLRIDYAERDKIVQEAKALVESKGAESADALVKKLDDFSNSQLRKNNSMLSTMIDSGGTGKASAIRQMVATPFITVDHHNKPIPMVISKSYTEGLDAGDYFSTLSGARRGMMDRALSVKEPGAFTKEIINTVIGTVIRENDCGTKNGIDVPVSEKIHLIGRYTIDGKLVDEAFLKKYTGLTVKVRSPLTCESQNPPCAKCFGLDETGKNPQPGTYLGAIAGQSLTEPGTQLVMKKFHTGGALASNAYESDTFHKGFERVKEVLELPKVLRDKSTLSTVSGVVSQINPAPQGGWFVYVGSTEHYVPGRLHVLVKTGQHVEKGDKIGSGAVKPQELAVLKNPLEAKKYMVDELAKAYQDQGRTIRRPLFETVVSSLVSKAQITDPGKSDFVPGDYANINKIDALNKDGAKIKATPVFSGLNQAPLHDEDFIARLNFRHLKETLVEAPAQAWSSELHGTNPIPGLVYGAEFGTKKASKKDSLLDIVRKRREAFAESGTLGDKDTSAAKDTSDNRTVITAPTNY